MSISISESFTGVLSLGNGNFKTLTGEPGSSRSTRFHDFQYDGSKFVESNSGALPPVEALATYANVLTLDPGTYRLRVALAVLEEMLAPHVASGRVRLLLRHVPRSASVDTT